MRDGSISEISLQSSVACRQSELDAGQHSASRRVLRKVSRNESSRMESRFPLTPPKDTTPTLREAYRVAAANVAELLCSRGKIHREFIEEWRERIAEILYEHKAALSVAASGEATPQHKFIPGELRSELKCAIPRLTQQDIEWIVSRVQSELSASRIAGIDPCDTPRQYGKSGICICGTAMRQHKSAPVSPPPAQTSNGCVVSPKEDFRPAQTPPAIERWSLGRYEQDGEWWNVNAPGGQCQICKLPIMSQLNICSECINAGISGSQQAAEPTRTVANVESESPENSTERSR